MVYSRRTLPQVFEELAEVARGHGAILVRRAVIDEQRAADDDRAARETAAAIEALELKSTKPLTDRSTHDAKRSGEIDVPRQTLRPSPLQQP